MVADLHSNMRQKLKTLLLTLRLTDSERWPAEPHPGAVLCLNAPCAANAHPLSSPGVPRRRCAPEHADNRRQQELWRKLNVQSATT